MRRLIMCCLIWIYAVCKSLFYCLWQWKSFLLLKEFWSNLQQDACFLKPNIQRHTLHLIGILVLLTPSPKGVFRDWRPYIIMFSNKFKDLSRTSIVDDCKGPHTQPALTSPIMESAKVYSYVLYLIQFVDGPKWPKWVVATSSLDPILRGGY